MMTRRSLPALVAVAALLLAAGALPLSHADDAPTDPPVVGPTTELLPAAASGAITPEAAAEAEVHEMAEAERTRAEVAAAKAEARAALANADATWAAYLADQRAQITAAEAGASASGEAGGLPPSLSVFAADAAAGPGALARRKSVFLKNLRDINKKNAKSGDMLAFGVNNFTHLSAGEFKRLYLTTFIGGPAPDVTTPGRKLLQTSTTLQCNKQVGFPSNLASITPYNVDHRSLGTVTPIRIQGGCGSCAAFSAMATIESAFISKWRSKGFTSTNTDLSEQDLLLCTTGNGCVSAMPHVYIDRVTCKGVAYESSVPYKASDNDRCPSVTRYTSGVVAWASAPTTERGFAQALLHNPVAIAVSANEMQSYKSGVWSCGGNQPVNHAVTLVAYTKSVPMVNGQRWNVFTAKNSWLPTWGEAGYVRFRADCASPGSLKMYQNVGTLPIRG